MKQSQYLDCEIVYWFGTFFSHNLGRRELVGVIEVHESKTQNEERDPVGEFQQMHTHALHRKE